MPPDRRFSPITAGAVALYALAYLGSLMQLSGAPGFEAGESLAVLLIFGLGFSGLAWVATRGITPAFHPVEQPRRESAAILGYLALFAVLFLGYGLSAIKEAVADGRPEETAILVAKLIAMVALPAALFARFGYTRKELFGVLSRGAFANAQLLRALLVMAVLLAALQLTIGRGPKEIATLRAEWGWGLWQVFAVAPLALLWMTLEAGLTEEFLFRTLLQTRLAAWTRSETAAVLLMALVFGLAHAPGYVLRGAHLMEGMGGAPDPLTAAAYAIVVVSPIGLMFGVLWARTRSLLLVVLLHGWTDLFPNLAPFARTWFG
jgi:membrane protease YdiL (CAAX protease family)